MKKRVLFAAGIVIVIITGIFVIGTSGLSEGMKASLDGVDLSNMLDGSYTGTYNFKRWSNTVVVHIEDGTIRAIDIEKDVIGAGITDCADEMISRVIEAQDTKVDAVSGATVTSKAYLKAIEDALQF